MPSLEFFNDGDVYPAAAHKNNFLASQKLQVLYTGTGFDTLQSGVGTDSDDHELTSISAADLGNADYLVIRVVVSAYFLTGIDSSYPRNTLQIQTKDLGGSYADSMTSREVWGNNQTLQNDYVRDAVTNFMTIEWVHTLTANEKTNGVQVKILATSVSDLATASASLTNAQTTIWTTT